MNNEQQPTAVSSDLEICSTEFSIISIEAVDNPNPAYLENGDQIEGSLIEKDGKINLVVILNVKKHSSSQEEFTFKSSPLLIRHKNRYSIAFRYSNSMGKTDIGLDHQMKVSFKFENLYGLGKENKVRIIPINENDDNVFLSLISYYLHRTEITYQANLEGLGIINENWNYYNPYMNVATFELPLTLDDNDIKKPKLAKGDLILTVK